MKNKEGIYFEQICKELKCEEIYKRDISELSEDELYYINTDMDTNYGNYRKNLNKMAKELGWDIDKYKDKRGRIVIPIEEKEFCKSAYKARNSLLHKEIKKGLKDDINIELVKEELDRLFNVIEKTFDEEKAKILKENLTYFYRYNIIKKIYDIKEPLLNKIFNSMENIREKGILINDSDAMYLIDFYVRAINNITESWEKIVKIYCDIVNSEQDNDVIEKNGEYVIQDNIHSSKEEVFKEAFDEYEDSIRPKEYRKETENQRREMKLFMEAMRSAK